MAEIGASLRETRMRAHIDISEVEAHTKIRAKYLRALENEEWNLLPGPVYVKSFLKTYGDYLGLDSRLLIDEFKRRYEHPSEHEVRAGPSSVRDRERDRHRQPSRITGTLFSPIGVIGVALVAIVVALYLIGSHGNNSPGGSTATITPSNGSHTQKHKTKSKSRTGTTTKSSKTGTNTNTTTTKAPSKATLAMVPTSTIWVCIENAAGATIHTGEYTAGETVPVFRSSELLIGLGNADATFTVDGKAYTPPASTPVGLKITPTGVTTLTTLPKCGE